MGASERTLRLVNPETGEIADQVTACAVCDEWARKYHGVLSQLGKLRAEMAADTDHDLFPTATRVFDYWRERCNHPRTKFTPEHFKEALPYLRDYGEDMCRRAVDGAAYDPYTTIRKNGSVQRHDGWWLIFQNPDKFTSFANRAPYHLPNPDHVKTIAEALVFIHGWEIDVAVEEARKRAR